MKKNRLQFLKIIVIILFVLIPCLKSYSQKEITKNGIKINRLDKKNNKQGSWFFFDNKGDITLSCQYQNDLIISPLTFYENNDTAFIRLPKMNDMETFIIHLNEQQFVGNYYQITKDSCDVEIAGLYKRISSDSFNIEENPALQNDSQLINKIKYWFNREIPPVYMFGNARLRDYFFAQFRSSNFIFSKPIYANITINESGIVKKVDFPSEKNTLSTDEEVEVSYIFSSMQRWQPYFIGNKTAEITVPFSWNSTIKSLY